MQKGYFKLLKIGQNVCDRTKLQKLNSKFVLPDLVQLSQDTYSALESSEVVTVTLLRTGNTGKDVNVSKYTLLLEIFVTVTVFSKFFI